MRGEGSPVGQELHQGHFWGSSRREITERGHSTTRIAGNCSCGYEIGGCKKLPLEWLGKSHEVMLDRKIHPGVYQAAVTSIHHFLEY